MSNKISIYIKYTKPRVWWLLVFTGFAGAILAVKDYSVENIIYIIIATVSVMLGSMGAESLTNYIDYNMDSVMERTKGRPLPRGEISKKGALLFGYILSISSIVILIIFLKFISALFMLLGIFDNVVIYSYWLKKISPFSIIFGGFSGAFPVLIGWYSITNSFSWLPWILFILVMIWIPVHVWSLAFRYKDDYKKANVPMLPVVYSDKTTAIAISFSSILLIVFSIIPYFIGIFNYIYLIIVLILSIPVIYYSYLFIKNNDKNSSFRLFIYTAPYLTFIFLISLILTILKIHPFKLI
ncbi:heme o synthase [Acidiplasma sp.]|uniref:heme o synthase n=1 Tax=Acidiplasma sp. TaxID=1872114 RepID=UPI00316AA837